MEEPATLTRAVLDFWFQPAGGYRPEWFRKDDAFDAAIRERFGAEVEAALAGRPPAAANDEELLARILLLDQFTRNMFRGTPRAFAGDAQALPVAAPGGDVGDDRHRAGHGGTRPEPGSGAPGRNRHPRRRRPSRRSGRGERSRHPTRILARHVQPLRAPSSPRRCIAHGGNATIFLSRRTPTAVARLRKLRVRALA